MPLVRGLEPPWTIAELAAAAGVSEALVRKQIKAGELQVRRIGRAVRIADAEARRWARAAGAERTERT